MLTHTDLTRGFQALGLTKGDVVLVHSSYKSFGGVEGGPQSVIAALLDVLGDQGTLVVPTFTFAFCEDFNKTGAGHFDVESTPSEMGILTEMVRSMPGARRSVNPIYSIAAVGKLAEPLAGVSDKNVFGQNSIFGKLHELNAKMMIIGLPYNNSWTFSHYIEEMGGCDYRYPKVFSGQITAGGKTYEDSFVMRVRDVDRGILTNVDPMGDVLERRGVVQSRLIGQATVRIMNAKPAFDVATEERAKNPSLLFEREGHDARTMRSMIEDVWFARRDIVSQGFDESLAYIGERIPLTIHEIPTGTKCWTWTVPEQWEVDEAYIEDLDGNRLLDLKDHPLHVVSYSLPIDRIVERQELLDHLHTKPTRPGAIPYVFKYYERDWGFCIQHARLKEFTQDRYRVVIRSRFLQGSLN